jgi:hypothetical protein
MTATVITDDRTTRGEQKVVRSDHLDDARRVGVDDHLADGIVLPGRFHRVYREIAKQVQHRLDIRWMNPVLGLLHAQDTTDFAVFQQYAESEETERSLGKRACRDVRARLAG